MGGVDWAGLEVAIELFGVDDVEDLLERIYVIKTHAPQKDNDMPAFEEAS